MVLYVVACMKNIYLYIFYFNIFMACVQVQQYSCSRASQNEGEGETRALTDENVKFHNAFSKTALLVCTHLNAFFIVNANIAMKI